VLEKLSLLQQHQNVHPGKKEWEERDRGAEISPTGVYKSKKYQLAEKKIARSRPSSTN